MKKLKVLSLAVCASLLMGSTTVLASDTNVEAEEFTICSYSLETGEEKYIECDTSFVVDQINNGATHISTPSFLGEDFAEQEQFESGISPNAIIGGDTRYKINDTTKAPYRSICLIEVFYSGHSSPYLATGCLIDSDIVLTSASAVNNFGNATEIRVYPGYNAGNQVYGIYRAKTVYTTNAWKSYAPEKDDWALLKITDYSGNATTVGNVTGYLGLDYIATGSLNGVSVYVTGYPSDKATGTNYTMWRGGGAITTTTSNMIYYNCDVLNEPGAPVTNSSNKIIGIHRDCSSSTDENYGVRVTSTLISAINYAAGQL